jgi:ATP synthase protein I
MDEKPGETPFSRQIGAQEARKLRALRKAEQSIWFGFGMSGLIGWSVAVPAVLGALLGLWLDRRYPGGHSWTLALLAAGLVFGCWNAWHWVDKEDRAMRAESEEKDE